MSPFVYFLIGLICAIVMLTWGLSHKWDSMIIMLLGFLFIVVWPAVITLMILFFLVINLMEFGDWLNKIRGIR